jgi:predicted aspartyl protease
VGLTKATLEVRGRKGATKIELIVDTGSVYTWIPTKSLESLGIPKDDFVDFRTIEGRRVRRAVGEAIVGYDGVSRHCVVVFGRPGDASVLGVTALENLALEVDPVGKKLRKAKALAAY